MPGVAASFTHMSIEVSPEGIRKCVGSISMLFVSRSRMCYITLEAPSLTHP